LTLLLEGSLCIHTAHIHRIELHSHTLHIHRSCTAHALLLGKATEVRTYSMLVRGDSNGRVYPEKLFKVVGTYAAYVLADSAFARLDHGSTGVQHIRLN
jgi:hypothetical protein